MKVSINTDSWHYKLVCDCAERPSTMCGYLWSLTSKLLMLTALIALGVSMILSMTALPLYGLYVYLSTGVLFGTLTSLGIVFILVAVVLITMKIVYLLNDYIFKPLKDKLCPTVTYY